jgi:hypothetical protein
MREAGYALPLSRESSIRSRLSPDGHLKPGQVESVTFTKVNRCMAEGRKAFLERFAEIYGGSA